MSPLVYLKKELGLTVTEVNEFKNKWPQDFAELRRWAEEEMRVLGIEEK